MATRVLFINQEYLKQRSTIEGNVDYDKIKPHVIKVQDLYLQNRLGTDFMDYLQDKIIADTLTGKEKALIDSFIKPMVAEYVQYEVLPSLNFKLTNKSVSKQRSDNSESSTLEEIKYLRNNLKNNAEFYDKRLYEHLWNNREDFPKWTEWDSKENLKKSNKSYFSGIYVSKPARRGLRWYE